MMILMNDDMDSIIEGSIKSSVIIHRS